MFEDSKYLETIKEFRDAINDFRANPSSIVPALKEEINRANKSQKGNNRLSLTDDNEHAIKESFKYLESLRPIPSKARISKALCRVAQQHADDLSKTNSKGIIGSDGSKPGDRIQQFVGNRCLEEEFYRYRDFTTTREILVDMLLDSAKDMATNEE